MPVSWSTWAPALRWRVTAKLLHAHSGVSGDLDLADAGLRAGDHLEGDIDELIAGVPGEGRRNLRLVESVFGHGLAHLLEGAGEPVWVKRVPG